ncbi:response regulator transcription factor [Massilia sp. YIM B04103]|uniref:helix-turn-helix transcriptional regulator n=1 Tax=Massilia sp. YIM B04103 TaxID=2963106 RepID=UPI00210E814B|nr:response regulator transcription factor [Massilia sp. YIM B04103]
MPTAIALIADCPNTRQHLRALIAADSGMLPLGCAASPAAAETLISRSSANVYLILCHLADSQAPRLTRLALDTHPGCAVAVVAKSGDDALLYACLQAGANACLQTECSAAELRDCLRALRSGSAFLCPTSAHQLLRRLQASAPAPLATPLTGRESDILRALGKGLTMNEIGNLHGISPHTAAHHVKRIYRKLGVHTRGEAVYEATQMGLL